MTALEALERIAFTTVSARVGDWGMEYKYVKDLSSTKPYFDLLQDVLPEYETLKQRDTAMQPKMVDYTTQHFLCPSCNETISFDESKGYNKIFNVFCRYCGQRLDWSVK